MTEDQIKHLVNRFLMWRLPNPWRPDNGISYARPHYAHAPADHDWPTGTNLFDASQADAMVRYMAEGMPGTEHAIDQTRCKHHNRRGVGSAGSDGSSSFTGHCLDCGKDLSYKFEGSRLSDPKLQNMLSN